MAQDLESLQPLPGSNGSGTLDAGYAHIGGELGDPGYLLSAHVLTG